MNRKQLIFLLAVLVIIGSAGLILIQRNKEAWSATEAKMGDKVMPDFQPNAVEAIHIKGHSDLNLVHENDIWRVKERNDYPADFHKISDILIKLKGLKVVESETVDSSELGRVNLDPPGTGDSGGTLIEFKDAQENVIDSLLVGRKHMPAASDGARASIKAGEPDGCYILLPKDPQVVYLISDPLSSIEPAPQFWLSRDFIGVDKIKSCELTAIDPVNSWKLARDTEKSPWILADAKPGETLDPRRPAQMAETLKMPRFVDASPTPGPAEAGLDKPRVVTIETFDHFIYTLKIGAKSVEGNYYLTVGVAAQAADGQEKAGKLEKTLSPWVYQVGTWILDPLVRDRAQLMEGAIDETAPAPAQAEKKSGWMPGIIH